MKKALLLLLATVAVLSCGKSGSSKVGEYIYEDAVFTIGLGIFDSDDTFTARISDDETRLGLPSSMVFRRSDRVLDVNGDGLLD